MTNDVSFNDAMRGYNRRKKAQKPVTQSLLWDCLTLAGNKLFTDRAGTPDSARRYMADKRQKLLQAGDSNCLTLHIF